MNLLPKDSIEILFGNNKITHMNKGSQNLYTDRHFKHRKGIYLDAARRYYDFDSLKAIIDILHDTRQAELFLHFSSNEAFRVETSVFPNIPYQHYTKQQIIELCEYANKKNIMIIPVLTVPAHSGGWLDLLQAQDPIKYVEVVSDFDPTLVDYWDSAADGEPIKIIKELITDLSETFSQPKFEGKQLFHLGMDEIAGATTNQTWLFWFMEHLINHVRWLNYKPVMWNDQVTQTFLDMAIDVNLGGKIAFTYWQQGVEGTVFPDDILENFELYNANFYTQTFHAHNLSAANSVPYMLSNAKKNGFRTSNGISELSTVADVRGGLITIWAEGSEARTDQEIITELRIIFTEFLKI